MNNSTQPASSSGDVQIASLRQLIDQKRQAQVVSSMRARAEIEAHQADIKAKISILPQMFGVATVPEAIKLIQKAIKEPRHHSRLEHAEREAIKIGLKEKRKPKHLAQEYGCSEATISLIKKEMGLSKKHKRPRNSKVMAGRN